MAQNKYRVWDKTDKVMLFVRVLQYEKRTFKLCSIMADSGKKEENTICFSNKKYTMNLKDITTKPFESCELMQFTGLKDKNGTDIYIGDILEEVDGTYLVRTYKMGFSWKGLTGEFVKDSEYDCDWIFDETGIIIGNGYANPELLDGY